MIIKLECLPLMIHYPCVQQQFSSDIADAASKVCLAHLFTYQDFDKGTLGLAYVAPPRAHPLGGICSEGKSVPFHIHILSDKVGIDPETFLWFLLRF